MTSAKTGPAGEWSTVGWACWETPAVFSGLKSVPVSGGIWVKRGKREMRLEERLIPCPAEQASLSERAHRILDKHMVNVEPQLTLFLGENRMRESFSNPF